MVMMMMMKRGCWALGYGYLEGGAGICGGSGR